MKKKVDFIEVLSDEEEEQLIEQKSLQLAEQMAQDEAAFRSEFRLRTIVNERLMADSTSDKMSFYRRIVKFNSPQELPNSCIRRQPNYREQDIKILPNRLLIYGTDYWSQKAAQKEAKYLEIDAKIDRVDGSHLMLTFDHFKKAQQWLMHYLKNSKVWQIKMEEQQWNEGGEESKLKGWFELTPYEYQATSYSRFARFCTHKQHDLESMRKQTKNNYFEEIKKVVEKRFEESAEAKLREQSMRVRNMSFSRFEYQRCKQKKSRRWQRQSNISKSEKACSSQKSRSREKKQRGVRAAKLRNRKETSVNLSILEQERNANVSIDLSIEKQLQNLNLEDQCLSLSIVAKDESQVAIQCHEVSLISEKSEHGAGKYNLKKQLASLSFNYLEYVEEIEKEEGERRKREQNELVIK